MKRTILLLLAGVSLLAACRKKPLDPEPQPIDPGYGSVRLAFSNKAGMEPLVLNTKTYVNAAGDSFTVSRFKYFISNITLGNDDGTWTDYITPTYNLIDQEGSHVATTATAILPASYTKVRFMVGVDSARNVSGAQEGDLDPAGVANGMFWTWDQGYIMALMEGSSPQSGDAGKRFFHHLGGFKGRFASQRWVEFSLPAAAVIRGGGTTEIHLSADILKWFSGGLNPIDLTDHYYAMTPNATTVDIANNMSRMFSVDAVHNE